MRTEEEKKLYAKKWAAENREKKNIYAERYKEKYLNKYLWKSCKKNAAVRNLSFEIDYTDIIIPSVCPVFQTPFVRKTMYAASVDRIDSTKGYIKGNIQVMSRLANFMKSSANKEQLRLFAKWVMQNE